MSPSILMRMRAVSDVEVAGSRVKTSVSLQRATCRGGHVVEGEELLTDREDLELLPPPPELRNYGETTLIRGGQIFFGK